LAELHLDGKENAKRYSPYRVLNMISGAKNELITPDEFRSIDYFSEIVGRVYPRYQQVLISNNAMDFDDLLMQMALLMRDNANVRERYQNYYEYVLVDEFQDTNVAQYQLVRSLAALQNNVFVVGDEDQGIYAFRGADYRNVMLFRHDYPQAKVVLLEQNYRSTQVVLDVARAVIDRNPHRTPKNLFTDRKGGIKVTLHEAYDDNKEATYVTATIDDVCRKHGYNYRDIAVMYRTNAQSRALEQAFGMDSIPYRLVGGVSFYKRQEIRDLMAYLRVIHNPNDSVSFNRIINTPARGIGNKTLATFQQWAQSQNVGFGDALGLLMRGTPNPLGKPAEKLAAFGMMLESWRKKAQEDDLMNLLDDVIAGTGYNLYINERAKDDEELHERTDNIRELRAQVAQDPELTLADFVTDAALMTDVDTADGEKDAVTLLTLHAAKGLEFSVVFITGLEDGLLPHFRSQDDPEARAEERRLAYVGLTRAKERVYVTWAFRRLTRGPGGVSARSPFVDDILLTGLTEGMIQGQQHRERQAYRRETTWDWEGGNTRSPRPTSSNNSEPRAKVLRFEDNQPPLKYRTGLKVQHPKFGDGVIIESKRIGNDEEVTVAFERVGIKRLQASFASLTILKG
ncbi:MAG: UvrD-helicase domain-containing protein, partial [Burkholderiales bacterium]|nr:UvrD-helicase domain-containing protein [Anaerolineae bacterium]